MSDSILVTYYIYDITYENERTQMRIDILEIPSIGKSPIAVVSSWHTSEKIHFEVTGFSREKLAPGFGIYDEMNEYWTQLQKQRQIEIFEHYKLMKEELNTYIDIQEMTVALRKSLTVFTDMHDLREIETWIKNRSSIKFPSSVKETFVQSIDKADTRDRSYILSDYISLIALALVCRAMLPIWSGYMESQKASQGVKFKEKAAFSLLSESSIMQSDAVDKLLTFIDGTVAELKGSDTLVVHGINSETYMNWLLSLVCVKRLVLVDIRGLGPHALVVSNVYSFVKHRAEGNDIKFEEKVKGKKSASGDDGKADESKASAPESVKVNAIISEGVRFEMEYAVRDPYDVVHQLCPTALDSDIEEALTGVRALDRITPSKAQKLIAAWLMHPIVTAKSFNTRSKKHTLEALAIAQVVLWNRGHKQLAMLVSAMPLRNDDEITLSRNTSRASIPKELLTELDITYPHMKMTGGKKTGQKPVSVVRDSIENLAIGFTKNTWRATASYDKLKEAFGQETSRNISAPDDIRTQLTKLIIEIGSRSYETL